MSAGVVIHHIQSYDIYFTHTTVSNNIIRSLWIEVEIELCAFGAHAWELQRASHDHQAIYVAR